MIRSFLIITFLSLLVVSQYAQADGLFLNGISPRSIGRGGTNIGHSDNGAIIFDNPAAMTNIEGTWLAEVGVDVLISDFEYQDANTAGTQKSSIGTPLPQIAIIKKSQDGHWAYGFGVFTPAGFSESYRMTAGPPFAGEQNYDSFGSLTKILPSLAWAPNDRLSIGGTLGVAVSHVEFETPYFIANPLPSPPPVVPLLLDLQGTGAALIWSTGLQYKLNEGTTLGLTYQSESSFKLDGPANATLPGPALLRFDADTRIKWPQSLGFGMKHQVNPKNTFSADVIWFDWSSAFDSIGISLNATAPPSFPDINESVPLDWKDTVSVRLGYEIDLAYALTVGKDVHVGSSDILGGDFNDSRHGAAFHAISIGAIKKF